VNPILVVVVKFLFEENLLLLFREALSICGRGEAVQIPLLHFLIQLIVPLYRPDLASARPKQ